MDVTTGSAGMQTSGHLLLCPLQDQNGDVDGLDNLFDGLSLGRAPSVTSAQAASTLNTSDVTLLSHAHGRQRRQERGIARRELKVCLGIRVPSLQP